VISSLSAGSRTCQAPCQRPTKEGMARLYSSAANRRLRVRRRCAWREPSRRLRLRRVRGRWFNRLPECEKDRSVGPTFFESGRPASARGFGKASWISASAFGRAGACATLGVNHRGVLACAEAAVAGSTRSICATGRSERTCLLRIGATSVESRPRPADDPACWGEAQLSPVLPFTWGKDGVTDLA
jgi:hypothetical protein